jgi:hypothetical protein
MIDQNKHSWFWGDMSEVEGGWGLIGHIPRKLPLRGSKGQDVRREAGRICLDQYLHKTESWD